MDIDKYTWISRRAHALWLEAGKPEGQDRQHWFQALNEYDNPTGRSFDFDDAKVRSVLVVDDEPLIRFDAVDGLEDAGFTVFEAANAGEALLMMKLHKIDAVFTDINMAGSLDGLQLARKIRRMAPQTRILITSGHVGLGPYDLESGISFIAKPYHIGDIARTLGHTGH